MKKSAIGDILKEVGLPYGVSSKNKTALINNLMAVPVDEIGFSCKELQAFYTKRTKCAIGNIEVSRF